MFTVPVNGPPPDLRVESAREAPRTTVLRVSGEIDMATAPQLAQALEAPSARDGEQVVVDLGGVRFMDTNGLDVLLGAGRRLAGHRGALVLRDSCAQVDRLIAVTGAERELAGFA